MSIETIICTSFKSELFNKEHDMDTDTFKIALYDKREDSPTYETVNEIYLGEHCPGLLRIPPGIYHGWMCAGQTEAYIVNVPSEMYNYAEPDEYRTDPHNNDIPYDWTRKDG